MPRPAAPIHYAPAATAQTPICGENGVRALASIDPARVTCAECAKEITLKTKIEAGEHPASVEASPKVHADLGYPVTAEGVDSSNGVDLGAPSRERGRREFAHYL